MWHAWERKVWKALVGRPEKGHHLEDQGVDVMGSNGCWGLAGGFEAVSFGLQ
jgi:hypothetical protein